LQFYLRNATIDLMAIAHYVPGKRVCGACHNPIKILGEIINVERVAIKMVAGAQSPTTPLTIGLWGEGSNGAMGAGSLLLHWEDS
jgi:hypothetical protein